jgi:hypothetical protein
MHTRGYKQLRRAHLSVEFRTHTNIHAYKQWIQSVFLDRVLVNTYPNGDPYNGTDVGTLMMVYMSMYVCIRVYVYVCIRVHAYVCTRVCEWALISGVIRGQYFYGMYVFMYACIYMYVRVQLNRDPWNEKTPCLCECMYVCMYVCM